MGGMLHTYGGWFGIKGLVAVGRTYHNICNVRKACDFFLSKELFAGGWGESYMSCYNKVCICSFIYPFHFHVYQ